MLASRWLLEKETGNQGYTREGSVLLLWATAPPQRVGVPGGQEGLHPGEVTSAPQHTHRRTHTTGGTSLSLRDLMTIS